MPTPATTADFLDVVRKSQQIDPHRLQQFLDTTETLPPEPQKLARRLIRDGVVTVFQAEQFLQGKHKGFTLGGYRILERIGAGGTGTVYLGEHEVMKRRVALKVLPTPFAEDAELLGRFRQEARAAALLSHPNVVHVIDFRREGALYFIVMEYIDGPNLQQMITRRGPLAIPLACEYVRQAALGLQHAHENRLVHRDVKPANLLVDPHGTVKVLDLGLVHLPLEEDGAAEQPPHKAVLGTADYLAPEQALNLHNVDARTDVYSLGATLYALLAGRPPFHHGTVGQKLMWHQLREPDPVLDARPEVPMQLALIVAKMLAKRPEDRYQTAAEVADAVGPWAAAGPRPEGRASANSLAEMKLGSRPNLAVVRPSAAGVETRTSARDDTNAVELGERERRPSSGPAVQGLPLRVALLVGVVAVVAGLVGGLAAFLLWGPKAGG